MHTPWSHRQPRASLFLLRGRGLNVGRYLVGAHVRVGHGRADDEVVEAVAIDVGAEEHLTKVGVLERVAGVRVGHDRRQLRDRDGQALR